MKPRNYMLNQFAGGHRPLDFYYRIHSGIKGSGMPALIANAGELTAKESTIWDLVSFIQILPYAEERAKLRKPPYNIFID